MRRPNPAPQRPQHVAATVALMLAAAVAAHVAAGGAPPSIVALVLVTPTLAVIGTLVARIGPRTWPALGLAGASQYLAHQLLVVTTHRLAGASQAGAGPCGHGHEHTPVATCAQTPRAGDATVLADIAWADARMVAFHAAATVATGLLLAQGDRLVAAVLARLRPSWRAPSLTSHPVAPRPAPINDPPPIVPRAVMSARRQPHRGPPTMAGHYRCCAA